MKPCDRTHLADVPLDLLRHEAKRRHRIAVLERGIEKNKERIKTATRRISEDEKEIAGLKEEATKRKWV